MIEDPLDCELPDETAELLEGDSLEGVVLLEESLLFDPLEPEEWLGHEGKLEELLGGGGLGLGSQSRCPSAERREGFCVDRGPDSDSGQSRPNLSAYQSSVCNLLASK